jgi:hypothetical protein
MGKGVVKAVKPSLKVKKQLEQEDISQSLKKVEKKQLKKNNLKKLGELSLAEKVRKAAEGAENDEEAAANLKGMLNKVDHSNIWNQHQKHLAKDPVDAAVNASLAKREKGLAAALWFVRKNKPKYMSIQMSMDAGDELVKTDKWISEKQCLDRFGSEEMQRHLNSGRLLWREDPWTPSVYQYKDQGDLKRLSNIKRSKLLQQGQEYEPEPDHETWFQELFQQDWVLKYGMCCLFMQW